MKHYVAGPAFDLFSIVLSSDDLDRRSVILSDPKIVLVERCSDPRSERKRCRSGFVRKLVCTWGKLPYRPRGQKGQEGKVVVVVVVDSLQTASDGCSLAALEGPDQMSIVLNLYLENTNIYSPKVAYRIVMK